MELLRTQYEKQYTLLKRRLEETETDNEHLTEQYRSSSKELLLYKNLIDAPNDPDSPTQSKDYQQLKLTINQILQENQYLYLELNRFKTTDPVYDQVKLLETTNKNLKLKLTKTLEECEQLRLINKKLYQQCQQQTSSPKQVS
jgi:regulator of replication initiation timing